MNELPPYCKPSGLNTTFSFQHLKFDQYIDATRQIIANARLDLHTQYASRIVDANAPKQYTPTKKTGKKQGILLLHGLFDSPFVLHDLYEYFKLREYHVRSLLLPGHGTVPGDLLHVKRRSWITATHYALNQFRDEVDELHVLGFSTGASLAMYYALRDFPMNSLILFAPAFKIKHPAVPLIGLPQWIGKTWERANWCVLVEQNDYARYLCMPYNAIQQVHELGQSLLDDFQKKTINVPMMMILTQDDEIIDTPTCINVFQQQTQQTPHLPHQLLTFGQSPQYLNIPKSDWLNSYFPKQRIINFSHRCLVISPKHPHYGQNTSEDFLHYHAILGSLFNPMNTPLPYRGAITFNNLQKFPFACLTYNPQFRPMMNRIQKFLDSLSQR